MNRTGQRRNVCRYFAASGSCFYGEQCQFLHVTHPGPPVAGKSFTMLGCVCVCVLTLPPCRACVEEPQRAEQGESSVVHTCVTPHWLLLPPALGVSCAPPPYKVCPAATQSLESWGSHFVSFELYWFSTSFV